MKSLNHIFRTIWSDALNTWVAVSEITMAKGKRSKSCVLKVAELAVNDSESGNFDKRNRRLRIKPLVLTLACCFSFQAQANPTGASVVSGTVSINQSGSVLTVTNTPSSIINWQGFSIASGETTNFIQQSASSSVLNRVISSGNPSVLLGTLTSNGKVYLINQAGILVGNGANINVAGLVASTLNISNADFLSGNLNFAATPNAGSVQNNGIITTPEGGSVYLVAPQITNNGIINTPKGETILAAGDTVQLLDTGTPGVSVQVTGSSNNATNLGKILADSGQIGVVGAVVKNSGTISANSLVSQGGRVFLKASQSIAAGGTISAQGATGGGSISVLADKTSGTVNVTGTLDASAPSSGNGGSIETSAANVQVADSANVTTAAANGKTGTWLIDPQDFTIGSSGDITGTQLGTELGNNSISILSSNGSVAGNGDIFVSDAVTWTTTNSLTLTAARNISVNNTITGTNGSIILNATAGSISETGAGAILVNSLQTTALSGTTLTGANVINSFAATDSSNIILFNAAPTLTLGPITTYGTLTVENSGNITVTRAIAINGTGNVSVLPEGVYASGAFQAGGNTGGAVFTNNSSITLASDGDGLILDSDQMTLAWGSISAPSVILKTNQSSTLTDLGTTSKGSTTTLQLSQADLSTINSPVIGLAANNNVTVTAPINVGSAKLDLNANTPGDGEHAGSISETGAGAITAGTLITTSVGGTTLTGSNEVGSFSANNTGSGDISLNNTAATLTISGGISQWGGGAVNISNTGSINVNSVINDDSGTVNLRADSLGACVTGSWSCATVTFNEWGSVTADTTNIYYNPVSYTDSDTKSDSWSNPYTNYVTGTLNAYMLVNDVTQLQALNTNLTGNYALGKDIDASATASWNDGAGFTPIGDEWHAFTGTVDGLNHTISNLTIYKPSQDYVGLFGQVGSGSSSGTISNLDLINPNVAGEYYVGGLVGENSYGTISNSTVTGGTVTGSRYVGGLVGRNDIISDDAPSTINNSSVSGTLVSGNEYVGGLVGSNGSNGTINNSSASATVSVLAYGGSIGGLVGSNYGTISNSHATGVVSGNYGVGGLVGENYYGGIINSYATGSVTGIQNSTYYREGSEIGGLVGYNNGGTISGSHATGSVSGVNFVGGLVGENVSYGGSVCISNSYATGNVTGSNNVGGLVGANYVSNESASVNISNSYATGNVTGSANNSSNVGGLVGENVSYGGAVGISNNSYATGNVNGNNNVGGLVGENYASGETASAVISNSYATGNVSGNSYVGGLVGDNYAGYRGTANITGSYATGSVSGSSYVGGLVGSNRTDSYGGAVISSSYATGNVTGSGSGTDVGGLVGYNYGGYNSTASISNSYATGYVTGYSNVGGLVGYNNAGYEGTTCISNSYATAIVYASEGNVGGLVGYNKTNPYGTATISYSYATGNINGVYDVGGLVGEDSGGTNATIHITNSYATGNVTGYQDNAGGLVGANASYGGTVSISNSYATGRVSGNYYTGGLVGYNYAGNNGSASISNSYATGVVSGSNYVGGLVGENYASEGTVSVTNTYATGNVIGTDNVGGLVGTNSAAYGGGLASIATSYSAGLVSGHNSSVGGLVGFNYGTYTVSCDCDSGSRSQIVSTITGSFWYQPSSESGLSGIGYSPYPAASAAAQGLTGSQMLTASSFTGNNGFNFTSSTNAWGNAWVIVDADGTLNNASGVTGATFPMLATEYSTTINSAHQLQLMAMDVTAHYTVASNINAAGTAGGDVWGSTGFVPVGTASNQFTGELDGGGNTISNLYINLPSTQHVGLIGYASADATIQNVGLVDANVTGSTFVGSLVGSNFGIISNSYATGSVTDNDSGVDNKAGGLVGGNAGTISDSYANVDVSGQGYRVGGLVGGNSGTISYSYATGTVQGSSYVGGLVGGNSGTICNSNASGDVSGTGFNIGGLVGGSGDGGIDGGPTNTLISNSYATGSVTGSGNVGGLVGAMGDTTVTVGSTNTTYEGQNTINNSYATGVVTENISSSTSTGNYYVGGLVGSVGNPTVTVSGSPVTSNGPNFVSNSYATGDVTANIYSPGVVNVSSNIAVGGLVGGNSNSISNSYATGTLSLNIYGGGSVSGNSYVGGLVGKNGGGSAISNSYATGGVALNVYSNVINNVNVLGSVSGSSYVGGLVGKNSAGNGSNLGPASISNSYSTGYARWISNGAVAGSSYVGGLVGKNGGSIQNAYAISYVQWSAESGTATTSYVGGLIGLNGGSGSLSDAYAVDTVYRNGTGATVSGGTFVGGLIGKNGGTATVSNAYWDTTPNMSGDTVDIPAIGSNSNNDGTTGVAGLTNNQMQTGSNFAGFYFTNSTSATGNAWVIVDANGTLNNATASTLSNAQVSGSTVTVTSTNGLSVGEIVTGGGFPAGTTITGFTNDNSSFTTSAPGSTASGVTLTIGTPGGTFPMLATEYSTSINNAHQLQLMAMDLSASYTLNTNIDASRTGGTNDQAGQDVWMNGFIPVGNALTGFTGTFDGQGNNIQNLHITQNLSNDVGLFGVVGNNWTAGYVNNVNLVGGEVFGIADVGGLVGDLKYGQVNNSSSSVWVNGIQNVGGLVGKNEFAGIVNDSSSSGSVTALGSCSGENCVGAIGGLVGYNSGNISYSSSSATVYGNVGGETGVGGLVGVNDASGQISHSQASGTAYGGSAYAGVGGLVGNNYGSIDSSSASTNVYTDTSNTYSVGGLAGFNSGSISNSSASGYVSGDHYVGGLVGDNDATTGVASITNSYATGNVNGYDGTGGLVGKTYNGGSITNSYATGNVWGGWGDTGGLVGTNDIGTISTSYATGSVSGYGNNIGGLVGYNTGTINSSYATGSVNGNNYVGGLVGYNTGTINSSYATGAVSGDSQVGGLVGSNSAYGGTALITNSYATGSVSGYQNVGGLVGENVSYSGTALITNSYATGSVSGNYGVGGLVGNNSGTVNTSYATGNVNDSSEYGGSIGGLAGYNNGTINNSYATGSVTSSSGYGNNVGGLAGSNYGTISNSVATGAVTGSNNVGGLVGYNEGNISNTYATGNVTGNYNVGGLVGYNDNSISASYAAGSVSHNGYYGGLIGYDRGSVSNSFYNSDVNGSGVGNTSDSAGYVFGMSSSELQNSANFTSSTSANGWRNPGWVFTTTPGASGWVIVDADGSLNNANWSTGETSPMLASEYSTTINTVHQLQLMVMAPSANYTLGSNIDASATTNHTDVWSGSWSTFVPIGGNQYYGGSPAFTGTFDGQGHIISDLTINLPSSSYVGLFGYTGFGSVIKNVGLVGGSVTGASYVGGLVGSNGHSYYGGGTISNSYATGNVTGGTSDHYSVGGLVGANYGSISNSYATGTVHGNEGVGGLVGYNYGYRGEGNSIPGIISNSYATGNVTGNNYIGGLVGYNDGVIYNTYAAGSASLNSDGGDVGGVAGYSDGYISNNYWNTTNNYQLNKWYGGVGGDSNSSGTTGLSSSAMQNASNFVGFNFTATPGAAGWVIVNADGSLNNTGEAGGGTFPMLASEYSTTINNAHQLQLMAMNLGANYTLAANIDASGTAGGDVWGTSNGWGNFNPTFVPIGNNNNWNSQFTGTFDGQGHTISGLTIYLPDTSNVGLFGVVGSNATIRNVGLVGGSVYGNQYVGALVGRNYGTVSNSHSTASVSAYGGAVGGLVGNNDGTISSSYATGNVTSMYGGSVGGLAGSNYGTINNSYATGNVHGYGNDVGGLVGNNSGSVNYGYATGNVTGTNTEWERSQSVGGLVGYNDGSINNSYATGNVSGYSNVGGLVGYNNGSITDTYSTGWVSGHSSYGGLVGYNNGWVNGSFWNTDTSGQTESDGGTGLNTAGMMTMSNFSNAGWSIADTGNSGQTWRIYDGYTAPLLTSFLTQLTVSADSYSRTYDGSTTTALQNVSYYTSGGSVNTDNILGLGNAYGSGGKHAGTYAPQLYSNQQGYDISYDGGNLTVTPAALTSTAAIGGTLTKTYDGTTTAVGASVSGSVNGAIWGDTITLDTSGLMLNYNSSHVSGATTISATGTAGFTIGSSSAGSLASDYSFTAPTISSVAGSITPLALAVSTESIGGTLTKTYNGTTAATGAVLNGGVVTGGLSGDILTLSGQSLVYNSAHVATANTISTTGTAVLNISDSSTGSLASDYSFTQPSASITSGVSITPAALTSTAAIGGSETMVYDGSGTALGATLSGSVNGAISGDTLNLTLSGYALNYNTSHVVGSSTISATGGTAGFTIANSTAGSLSTDYSFTGPTIATETGASITPAALTSTAAIGGSKTMVYDGSSTAVGATLSGSVNGAISGDTLNLTLSGYALNYNTSHVVGSSTISATGGTAGFTIANSTAGSLSTDYSFTGPTIATETGASITPAALTSTAAIGGSKTMVYDGSSTAVGATLSGSVNGAISGDTLNLTLSGYALNYNTSHVVGSSTISATGGTAGFTIANSTAGSLSTDYSFTGPTIATETGASITPAAVSFSGSMVYNASTSVAAADFGTGGVISTGIGGQTLDLTGAGTVTSSHVVAGTQTVNTSGLTLGNGTGTATDYTFTGGTQRATITPAALTSTAAIGGSKTMVYDGSSTAVGATLSGSVNGAISGDTLNLTLSGYALNYNTSHVVGSSTISATGGTAGFTIANSTAGSLSTDYSFTGPTIATETGASITPAALTSTAAIGGSKTMVYDGSSTAVGATLSGSVNGAISGDTLNLTLSGYALNYNTSHVVGSSTISATGGTAGFTIANSTAGSLSTDYSFTGPTIATETGASITPALLTASLTNANVTKTYDGTTSAPTGFIPTYNISGLVAGDTAAQLTSSGAAYNSPNVTATTLTVSGLAIGNISGTIGSLTTDYTLNNLSSLNIGASITQLASVTWIGGTSGNWSLASNWAPTGNLSASGAIPDGANVAAVVIPTGATVTYDSGVVGTTTLTSLASQGTLAMSAGVLSIGTGGLTTSSYSQTAGALNSSGNFTVSNSFVQSGGTITLTGATTASITQATGNLSIANLSAPTINLTDSAGNISQTGALVATTLATQSSTGTTLNNTGNQIASFNASNSASGNVALTDTASLLTITGISNTGTGSVTLNDTGSIRTSATIAAGGGAVSLNASGSISSTLATGQTDINAATVQLTAGTGIGSADSAIKLVTSNSNNTTQTLNATTLTGGGNISNTPTSAVTLGSFTTGDKSNITYSQFGQDLTLTNTISSAGGTVNIDPPVNFTMSNTAVISSGGGAIGLQATGNVVLASVNAGSGAINLGAGGNVSSAPGYTGVNLIGSSATLNVKGAANIAVQVQSLDANVDGHFDIIDNGVAVTDQPVAPILEQVIQTVIITTTNGSTDSTSGSGTSGGSSGNGGSAGSGGSGTVSDSSGGGTSGASGTFGDSDNTDSGSGSGNGNKNKNGNGNENGNGNGNNNNGGHHAKPQKC